MAFDRMTPLQEDALRDVAQKFADQDHDAEMVATRLRVYAMEWHIHYTETEVIQIAEEAVAERAKLVSFQATKNASVWIERKGSDRRKGERRQGERRRGARRKPDRRRKGFAALVMEFFRFGKGERRRSDRRARADRRRGNRRHNNRRLFVRRRTDR